MLALRACSGVVVLLLAGEAGAEDAVEVCASASEQAQVDRDEGRLRSARRALIACAAEQCPGIIRQDCATWLEEVEAAMPTVVLSGVASPLRRVEVDDEVVDAQLGRAFPVDPGRRRFVVETADGELTRVVVVREGEKSQPVVLAKPSQPTPETARDDGFSVPLGAWIVGGVGLAGVGVFAGLSAYAKREVDDMRASCAPFCPSARVDDVRRFLIGGNASLALGLTAVAAAATWTVVEATSDVPSEVAIGLHGLSLRW